MFDQGYFMLSLRLLGIKARQSMLPIACAISALAAAPTAYSRNSENPNLLDAIDPVVFRFATVGDSRQDLKSPDPTTLLAVDPETGAGAPNLSGTLLPQDKQWLQNSKAWSMIQDGIQAQNPNLLFFNGDMIFGYGRPILPAAWSSGQPGTWNAAETVTPDTIFEYVQYAFWRGTIANLFNTGTYVIPVPGNHETQCSYSAPPYSASKPNPNCNTPAQGNLTGKTAYAENESAFRNNVGDLIQDLQTNLRFSNVSGFTAKNVSGLTSATAPLASVNNGPITSDQSELSYSFDVQASASQLLHFVVINTDPAGADSTAPADWLLNDLTAAKSRGVVHSFVFGHKAAFTYNYLAASGGNPGPGGLDVNTTARNAFWKVIAQFGATYFSGHEHTVNVSKNADPTGTYSNSPYQVIVGSGGSPFDNKLVGTCPSCSEPTLTNPFDRYYAWALVSVHKSGRVSLGVHGFSDAFGPIKDLKLYNVDDLQPSGRIINR